VEERSGGKGNTNLGTQEINHRKQNKKQDEWESVLFFGCRHRKHDYIYEEELTGYSDDQTLTHLHVAFSREQDKKVYVQDKLEEHEARQKLWQFLNEKNGYFYVCGYAIPPPPLSFPRSLPLSPSLF
jgi:NADPH-ferrihemoprotein reductase